MLKVAIGPEKDFPSWNWVGKDTARELKKHYSVTIFKEFKDLTSSYDAVLIIKHLPSISEIDRAKKRAKKVIYCPIDFYQSRSQIESTASILRNCTAILSHSSQLIPLFENYSRSFYIDHHCKFVTDEFSSYKKNGFVLWVGGFQYIPFLLDWVNKNNPDFEIKILADIKNHLAIIRASEIASKLKIKLNMGDNDINGIDLIEWSEEKQIELLMQAKAAIDIKGNDFNQQHKPATKSQKYVACGVPIAMNDSESVIYFKKKGLILASPKKTDRWFSEAYWEETIEMGRILREELSLESIGNKYRSYIDYLVKGKS